MSWLAPDRQRVVWLGAAGTATAFGLLRSAREVWRDRVAFVAADINPRERVAASAVAAAFEQVPFVVDPGFSSFLLERLAHHGVDTYVPILDSEIVVAAELRDGGELPAGMVTLAPSVQTSRRCLDKLAMAEWLVSVDLPTPQTATANDAAWRPEGLIAKPRTGVGSVGFQRLDAPEDLERLRAEGGEDVVQSRCEPPEITVDAFRGAGGEVQRAVCRERLEVKAGVATKARVFDDDELAGLARRLGDGLELQGAFCFQVMRSSGGGGWAITDVNPRPGAGTRMSAAVGVDVLAATLANAWGLDPRPMLPPLAGERYVARQYAEFVVG